MKIWAHIPFVDIINNKAEIDSVNIIAADSFEDVLQVLKENYLNSNADDIYLINHLNINLDTPQLIYEG